MIITTTATTMPTTFCGTSTSPSYHPPSSLPFHRPSYHAYQRASFERPEANGVLGPSYFVPRTSMGPLDILGDNLVGLFSPSLLNCLSQVLGVILLSAFRLGLQVIA